MEMQKNTVLLIILVLICSCTHPTLESAGVERQPASVADIIEQNNRILAEVRDAKVLNEKSCADYVGEVAQRFTQVTGEDFVPRSNSDFAGLKREGEKIIDGIYEVRLALRKRMGEMSVGKNLDPECLASLRKAFVAARFAEDYLIEWLHGTGVYKHKDQPTLAPGKPTTWSVGNFELKGGDVLLIRGKSYVSAMIAQISDDDGSFSHMAIIGEDPKGKKYVIESLIQTGVIMTPLEEWRKEKVSRTALFRFYEPKIAKKAASYAYELGRQSQKKNIRYDFGMNEDDYSTMFCSEVVHYAYKKASGGGLKIPLNISTLNKFKGGAFPWNMGVKRNKVFSPNDIEVDPQFELLAEYRHQPYLRSIRVHDAVLQSIYFWMREKGYRYQSSLKHSALTGLGKTIRQFGILKDIMPKYMPVKTMNVVLQFENVYAPLYENLGKVETDFYRSHGYQMTFQQMLDINEQFRKNDCQLDLAGPRDSGTRSRFHWFFAPVKRQNCALF